MEESQIGNPALHASEIEREAMLWVSCSRCEKLHRSEQPFAFNPVCSACAGGHPMRSLEMSGSYPLSDEAIDDAVTRVSAGNFALGYMDGGEFVVFYVGRSDSDVKQRLHEFVDEPSRFRQYAPASKVACGHRHRGPLPFDVPALDHVGLAVASSYTRFAFSYAPSAEASFGKECRNFHDFGGSVGLDNECHPVPTPGRSWSCPENHA